MGTEATFDWVSAFAECSLSAVFEKLKLEVQKDVDSRNAQLKLDQANYSFKFIGDGGRFSVATLAQKVAGRAIKFHLTNDAILVTDFSDSPLFSAKLTLNDERECRFVVDGKELESWAVRKRALTELLFTSPWDRS